MNDTHLTKSEINGAADYEVMANELLADMKRLEQLMQRDRGEIDYLKAESARLESENRVVLLRLNAMF